MRKMAMTISSGSNRKMTEKMKISAIREMSLLRHVLQQRI
jgi:hypothetical protein